jgi:hypothetical protein
VTLKPAPVRIPIEGEPSYLSLANLTGFEFFDHVQVMRSGSLDVVTVGLDPDGVQKVSRAETSRKKFREMLDQLARDFDVRMAPAPGEYVAWRVRQALQDCASAGRKGADYHAAKLLERLPEVAAEPRHPALVLSPVRDAEARVTRSYELHQEPELARWIPRDKALDVLKQHVDRHQREGAAGLHEGLSPEAKSDRVQSVVHEAIDEFYTPAERARLATELRDAALLFVTTRRPERALDAVAVADAVETSGMFTTATHTIPFVFTLFYKYLLLVDQRGKSRG